MKFYIYILPKHSPFDLVCLSAIDLVDAFARVGSIGRPWRLKIIVIFQEIFGSVRSSRSGHLHLSVTVIVIAHSQVFHRSLLAYFVRKDGA